MSHSLRGQRLSPSTHQAIYLWGRGSVGHDLGKYLRSAQVDERNKIAEALALEHGCSIGIVEGAWAVSIVGDVDEREFDALTRDDPAVMGWSPDRNAKCPPSVALRNALNSLNPTERDALASNVAARFLRPAGSAEKLGDKQWLARDGRLVVFDDELAQWRLGEYAAT
ncbi:MAG TPA: hypothetical protein VNF68_00095 [Candidatus Baltobacteraceae bacterium]|nr:hypothetical protein [Candidatus Baltobacteraceae bacterium]